MILELLILDQLQQTKQRESSGCFVQIMKFIGISMMICLVLNWLFL